MGRRLQTIYEYLSCYQENEINESINRLSNEEKLIIKNVMEMIYIILKLVKTGIVL